jgi:hypothetical protein
MRRTPGIASPRALHTAPELGLTNAIPITPITWKQGVSCETPFKLATLIRLKMCDPAIERRAGLHRKRLEALNV